MLPSPCLFFCRTLMCVYVCVHVPVCLFIDREDTVPEKQTGRPPSIRSVHGAIDAGPHLSKGETTAATTTTTTRTTKNKNSWLIARPFASCTNFKNRDGMLNIGVETYQLAIGQRFDRNRKGFLVLLACFARSGKRR